MYLEHFGLTAKPFELHPDPGFLYWSPGHDEAFTHLEYAVAEAKGFVVLTGEVGAGKTTLVNHLVRRLPAEVELGVVNNPSLGPPQFLKAVCREYGLEVVGGDKADLVERFNRFLLDQYARRRRVALIVDEAQRLPLRTLEELRLLSNLEEETQHLLQVILVGQPELRDALGRPELEQLRQRVTVHCHLGRLDRAELGRYVRHRLEVAGVGGREVFDEAALDEVFRHSAGTPRLVNTLCDTALVFAFGADRRGVDRDLVGAVAAARAAGGLLGPAPGAALGADPGEGGERLAALEAQVRRLERVAEDETAPRLDVLTRAVRQLVEMVRRLRRDLAAPSADRKSP